MKKKFLLFSVGGLIIFTFLFFSGFIDRKPILSINADQKIMFTDKRPDYHDPDIILSIAAAFSGEDGRIIGHYSTGKGRKGTSSKSYTTIHLDNSTYFQQASLVRNHKPKTFKDSRLRFRRALCKKNEMFSIVHSSIPVTLSQFANQLTEYENAWNLDMGTYSYGWYRDDKNVLHHLGISSIFNKKKQTNWIIIRKS